MGSQTVEQRIGCTMAEANDLAQTQPDTNPVEEMKTSHESPPQPLEVRVGSHSSFEGMDPNQIRILTDCAMAKVFAPGDYLFREGDFADRFYLIERGALLLEARDCEGRAITIEKVGPDMLVGWSWLLPPYLWHFEARAIEPTTTIFFYGTMLRESCAKDPSLSFELFRGMSQVMAERLEAACERLLALQEEPAKPERFRDNPRLSGGESSE
jgi:CRP-like cAMP-binding protein